MMDREGSGYCAFAEYAGQQRSAPLVNNLRLHFVSTNSVGVLPVICRKAWENAERLA
jgi:hypothetical protein